MKTSFLLSALSLFTLLLLPSCVVDPNYYGGPTGSSHYGSSSYTTLPYGYKTVHVSGTPYYYYGNSWYRRSGSRYITCSRPHGYHGSIGHVTRYGHGISRLPYGYRTITVGNSLYYNHGSTWYRRSGSRYITCARPIGYRGYPSHYRSPNYGYKNYGHKNYDRNYRKHRSIQRSRSDYHRSSDYYRSKKKHRRDKHYRSGRSSDRHRIKDVRKSPRKPKIKKIKIKKIKTPKPPKEKKKRHPLSKPVKR